MRSVGLIVTSDTTLAEHLVHGLRALDWIAVSVDNVDIALEMMDVVEFSLVADDRRYRRFAFGMGVRAYAGKPCTWRRLREMLGRLERGERHVELVAEVVHGQP